MDERKTKITEKSLDDYIKEYKQRTSNNNVGDSDDVGNLERERIKTIDDDYER